MVSYLKILIVISLIASILGIIGLVSLTQFSFNAQSDDDDYAVKLKGWQKGFARYTLILAWISLISWSLVALLLLFSKKFNPLLHTALLVSVALLVIEIMGVVYLTRYFFQKNDGEIQLKKWQYNFTKVIVVMGWIMYIMAIFSNLSLLSSKKYFNFYKKTLLKNN